MKQETVEIMTLKRFKLYLNLETDYNNRAIENFIKHASVFIVDKDIQVIKLQNIGGIVNLEKLKRNPKYRTFTLLENQVKPKLL